MIRNVVTVGTTVLARNAACTKSGKIETFLFNYSVNILYWKWIPQYDPRSLHCMNKYPRYKCGLYKDWNNSDVSI
jgi:hypothetical protein